VVNNHSVPLTFEEVRTLLQDSTEQPDPIIGAALQIGGVYTLTDGPFAGLDILLSDLNGTKLTGTVVVFGRETVVTVDRTQVG
jgi:transcription antitermination factor NusG